LLPLVGVLALPLLAALAGPARANQQGPTVPPAPAAQVAPAAQPATPSRPGQVAQAAQGGPGRPAGDFVMPGDNLVVEGVPPIPREVQQRVGRYTEFRAAGLSDWHPVRREILINTRFADVPQLHRVLMPGGARTQLTFFPDRVGGAIYEPTKGDYFLFGKDVGGGEWFQFYRFDVQSGDITLLTDGKSRNTSLVFSKKGDRIAYASTRRTRKDNDLWIMNPLDKASDRMLMQLEGGGWGPLDFSPDDTKLVLGEEVSATESYLWLVDLATAQKTLLTPKGGPEKSVYGRARFGKDGKGLYVTTDKESEFQRLAYVDLKTGQHSYLTTTIPWDIEDFDLSRDGTTIVLSANEDGFSKLYVLDTATKKLRPLPQVPKGVVGELSIHKSGSEVAFALSSATSSSDVYSLGLRGPRAGKLERWTQSETGGLNTTEFVEPELVKWTSFDGKQISGFLYKPPKRFTGKRPVIVNIHGGPEAQFRPTFLGRNNYYLNELGVALLFPNVRGSSGYGKTFLKLDDGFAREGSYKDAEALYKWLKQRPDLDGDRIMVTGGSYGGHMTLVSASHHSALIRCALAVVGMSNLVTFLENTEGYRRDLRRVEYGDERDPKMREFLLRIAPLNRAKDITKPLFIVQGQNDPRVPASEAEQMLRTVRGHGTPAWYLLARDEGHGFAKRKNQDFQFYATVLFIQQYLLP
jgi:dipeptidyl aminopeptidase/acylaminoacyl peptidase